MSVLAVIPVGIALAFQIIEADLLAHVLTTFLPAFLLASGLGVLLVCALIGNVLGTHFIICQRKLSKNGGWGP